MIKFSQVATLNQVEYPDVYQAMAPANNSSGAPLTEQENQ